MARPRQVAMYLAKQLTTRPCLRSTEVCTIHYSRAAQADELREHDTTSRKTWNRCVACSRIGFPVALLGSLIHPSKPVKALKTKPF